MDRTSPEFQAFLRVHESMTRQGPGSKESTAQAIALLPALPPSATIYDLGCGPGHSTLMLAEATQQKVVAVDLEETFLLELKINAVQRTLSELIITRQEDMANLSAAPQSIDLIWAEGSIYCIGFDNGLRSWQPLLANGGVVACTEWCWLTETPSEQAAQFWNAAYPQARTVAANIAAAEQLGYTCLSYFVLPPSCWWDEYYNPLQANIERLHHEAASNKYLADVIADTVAEINCYRDHGHDYGYVFFILQK